MSVKLFLWELPLYGILFFSGIIISSMIILVLRKRQKISLFDLLASSAYAMIGAGIGAKMLFIVVSLPQIIELFNKYSAQDVIFSILKGGFVFYGGLVGGAIGLYIYIKQYKLNFFDFSEIFAVALPIGHALGRVGCFFAGCCYGIEYHGPFNYIYTTSAGSTPLGIPLLPIQLIEAICLFILFVVLIIIFFKKHLTPYICTKTYIIVYSILRFVLEFFRGDKERGILLLSTSQWISIGIIAFVIFVGFYKSLEKHKKNL